MEELINIDDLHFTLKDDDGNEIKCDILYEAVDEINQKAYIAYTDYVKDENDKYRIIISELINDNESYRIIPIYDEDVHNSILNQVNQMFSE